MVVKSPQGAKGAAELKKYWAYGEGRQKWINSPRPWTTLRDLLLEHVSARVADGLASNIFRLATGHFPSQRHKGERL